MSSSMIEIGRVGPAHGLKGYVILYSYSATAEDFLRYKEFYDAQKNIYSLADYSIRQKDLLVRFSGIDERSAAEALHHKILYIKQEQLAPLEEEEYYYQQLKGLGVRDKNGLILGEVVQIYDFGAGPLLEIAFTSGYQEMVLFSKDFVPSVDLSAGYLVVDTQLCGLSLKKKPSKKKPSHKK